MSHTDIYYLYYLCKMLFIQQMNSILLLCRYVQELICLPGGSHTHGRDDFCTWKKIKVERFREEKKFLLGDEFMGEVARWQMDGHVDILGSVFFCTNFLFLDYPFHISPLFGKISSLQACIKVLQFAFCKIYSCKEMNSKISLNFRMFVGEQGETR